MQVLIQIPKGKFAKVRKRVCSAKFLTDKPTLLEREVNDGFKWVTFESQYIVDLVKVVLMVPRECKCWELVEHELDGVFIMPISALLTGSKC